MSDDDHLVVFTPSGHRGDVSPGTTVLDAARRLGVDIDSVCGGRGICGRCQVEPMFGEFAKHGITADASHLSPPGTVEADYRGRRPLTEDRRLSCTATIRGDLVVDVPAESQVHRQVIRKDIDQGDIELDPVLVLRLVEFGEGDDLLAALGNQWGLTGLELPPDLDIVADGSSLATVAIRDDSQVVAVWPGLRRRNNQSPRRVNQPASPMESKRMRDILSSDFSIYDCSLRGAPYCEDTIAPTSALHGSGSASGPASGPDPLPGPDLTECLLIGPGEKAA